MQMQTSYPLEVNIERAYPLNAEQTRVFAIHLVAIKGFQTGCVADGV